MKLPYSDGSIFLVPLRNGGYVRGVVARGASRGRVLLGYFFGPRIESPKSAVLDDLEPAHAALRLRFGDLGLINGEWAIVGNVPNWVPAEWPMPEFVTRDPLSKRAWVVRYADSDPRQVVSECPTDFDSHLPEDSLAGYGAAEIILTKVFGN
jgi:immunity protein 26 of polymorphic toxin system